MPFSRLNRESASSSGVATVDISDVNVRNLPEGNIPLQVTVHDITTGTGTVTISVMPSGTDEFQPVADGTALLSSATDPKTFTILGWIDQVKATSSSSSDVFKLLVGF